MWVVTTESNMNDYDDQSVDTYTYLVATEEDAKIKVVSEYLEYAQIDDWFEHPEGYRDWSELIESRDEAFGKAAIFIKTDSDEEKFKAVECLYQWFQKTAPVLFAGDYCEQHFKAYYTKQKAKTESVDSDWNAVIGTIEKISDLPF